MYRYYIVDVLNTLNDELTLVDVVCVLVCIDSYFYTLKVLLLTDTKVC